jgi:hypothetical protein
MTRWLLPATVLAAFLSLGSSCFDRDDHSPTSPSVLDALVVEVSESSVPADGASTVKITGRIDPAARAEHPKLKFKTTEGVFTESTATPPKEVDREVAADGSASATLRSSRQVGPAEVTVLVENEQSVFAKASVTFTESAPGATLQLATPASAPADGATLSAVTATVASGLPSGSRTVTFKTNLGQFADNSMKTTTDTADADNRARADLVSPVTTGTARLTASVDGVTVERSILFTQALPDDIIVGVDRSVLEASNETEGKTTVTVRLLRDVGSVSDNTPIEVSVVAVDGGAEIPMRVENLGPVSGNSETFTLIAGPITFRGPAEVVVTVDGSTARGSALIEVVAAEP